MDNYRFYNNISGWIVFIIASAVYLLTMESTASLWDCGEFIACGYKLEIGHPPGAPFFMLLGRLFGIFAPDVSLVALFLNALSAFASSFTTLFLFWTITHMARKIVMRNNDYSLWNIITVIGSGAVGALAYTFTDTFWFSAVEGEVYATSSLFTALVFWAILKWENDADNKHADRWLILIAYLMGLSIGVHLLNLLTIPAIVLVYYFKKYETTRKGFFLALLTGGIILGVVQYGIIPGVVQLASYVELFAVNHLHMPYNSGVFIYLAGLTALIIWGLRYTARHKKAMLNLLINCFLVILIGYSTYALIVIRSKADPPLDENNPENFFALLSYINREQYGDRPLLYGPQYSAPVTGIINKGKSYIPKDGRYVVSSIKRDYEYDERFMTFFPRMYSRKGDHVRQYKSWAKIKGTPIRVIEGGQEKIIEKPTFGENMRFFFRYQVGHMYIRYFMWNFSGRQNDTQGYGDVLNGNWITGIPFIDNILIGDQNIPKAMKEHKSRNVYYMLPFILGVIGFFYQYMANKKDFAVTLALFFFTGLAIIIYLNQPPIEPRERDYTYAASFYAFAIWIGMGVLYLIEALSRKIPRRIAIVASISVSMLLVPGILATENWDDHDRSGRYTARDMAYNYLNSCAPNAILFTNGDNDTFPLWYIQEVEGVRTDVRVVNLMLLNTDWHIVQSRRKAYESDKLPFSLSEDKYVEGTNNIIYIRNDINRHTDIKKIIDFVASDDVRTKLITQDGERLDYIPTGKFTLTVDSATVVNNGTVPTALASQIVKEINWETNKKYFTKSELALLDILANNNWERPIYFVSPGNDNTLGLDEYLQMEGYAYRLVPVRTPVRSIVDIGRIDADYNYKLYMETFLWGRMNQPDVYLGHFDIRTIAVLRLRTSFHRLALALIQEGKKDSALAVLDRCMEIMPSWQVPYDYYMLDIISDYYLLGKTEKANSMVEEYSAQTIEELQYFIRLQARFKDLMSNDINTALAILQRMGQIAERNGQKELAERIYEKLNIYGVSVMGL